MTPRKKVIHRDSPICESFEITLFVYIHIHFRKSRDSNRFEVGFVVERLNFL